MIGPHEIDMRFNDESDEEGHQRITRLFKELATELDHMLPDDLYKPKILDHIQSGWMWAHASRGRELSVIRREAQEEERRRLKEYKLLYREGRIVASDS